MTGEISVVEAKPRPLAVVRVTTAISTWPKRFMHTLDKVYAAVRAGHVKQTGHNVMVYRHRGDGLVDIECGVEVAGKFEPIGEVVYSETPSGLAVTATHPGPYQEMNRSYDAIRDWSRKHGHQLSRTCWEIYGDWEEDPARLRTELFHLVRA